MDEKVCRKCGELKPITEYYNNKSRSSICKLCIKIEDKKKYWEEKIENDGGFLVRQEPNVYTNDIQRQATFRTMKLFGWTFNEENNIWYKLPFKNPDGTFNLKNNKIKEDFVFVEKFKTKRKIDENKRLRINKVVELTNEKYTQEQICGILKITKPTIRAYLKLYYDAR